MSFRPSLVAPQLSALVCLAVLCNFQAAFAYEHNWSQASGPNGDWTAHSNGKGVPLHWSVTTGENICWRTTLPEEGQSGIAVSGDRVFLTTMKPLPDAAARKEGHDIVGYCLDRRTGKILWTVDLPGSAADSTYAYGFSDSSTPTPVSDGKHVYFCNASGLLACFDFNGKQVWTHHWQPTTGRPFNKQWEPILVGGTLLNMEPRDPNDPKREAADPWNYLRGLDTHTGKTLWISDDALTHYNTPVAGTLPNGTNAILVGRGAHHDTPEKPTGLSLISLAPGRAGKTLWRYEGAGKTLYTMHWNRRYAFWFPEDTSVHHVIDTQTGHLLRTQSLTRRVDYRRWDAADGQYVLQADLNLTTLTPPVTVFPGWYTNLPVAGYDYFLCFTDAKSQTGPPYCIGRVAIESGKVEYLELPTGVVHTPGQKDAYQWRTVQKSSTVNARGIDAAGDPRSQQDGWYWCFLGNPTAVDDKIFFTTMTGLTYVIDGRAKVLDEKALLSVNDLGPAGQTWSLNAISYADGRLYHRSMKEVVCIGSGSKVTKP